MQLTQYTDYGLRVLIYLAAAEDGGTVRHIAEQYGISQHHLVKIAHRLSQLGYIETTRGRSGGMRLALAPEDIRIGDVVRAMEPGFDLVECFDMRTNTCPIAKACGLKSVLAEANEAFLGVLDGYTLNDVTRNRRALSRILLSD